MERVASMQEQIGKESRDMETLRNNPKGMPEIKNIITNAECLWWAHQYIGHDWAKDQWAGRYVSEPSQTENREKRIKNENRISKNCGTIRNVLQKV